MSDKALNNLAQHVAVFVRSAVLDTHEDASGDTPIEKLLHTALSCRVWFGLGEHVGLVTLATTEHPPKIGNLNSLILYIKPQVQLENWRVDFVVYAYDHNGRILKQPGWRSLIVECDGHDFHERTKEQAKRDRSRDRRSVRDGQDVMRFTGSEIWNDSWECAGEILDWATRSFG